MYSLSITMPRIPIRLTDQAATDTVRVLSFNVSRYFSPKQSLLARNKHTHDRKQYRQQGGHKSLDI